ncbi:MAG: Nif3-like dinuclear metal center hexameric protein, partial [Actinobacteria bacterium]|nr:Nif3-like dinuclear metal center hexameric protein [Actinomycetota bacterium]
GRWTPRTRGTMQTVATLTEIAAHLDELLRAPAFHDFGPNGVQVPGREDVATVVTGVSAQRALFERALDEEADAVLVHHGLFWRGAPPALDRAARLGDAWLAGPYAKAEDLAGQVRLYRESCENHGTNPLVMAVRRDIHVGSDDADARRVSEPVVAAGYRGLNPDVLIIGGPERVADEFRRLAEMGFTDVLVRHLADDQADVLASFERLAEVRALVADA